MNNLQKIKDLILKSSISTLDQTSLIELFSRANDSDLENVADLFSKNPTWIEKISENYKAKQATFATGNSELWKKIIETEEKQLEEIEAE
jgi:hypothetical protein